MPARAIAVPAPAAPAAEPHVAIGIVGLVVVPALGGLLAAAGAVTGSVMLPMGLALALVAAATLPAAPTGSRSDADG